MSFQWEWSALLVLHHKKRHTWEHKGIWNRSEVAGSVFVFIFIGFDLKAPHTHGSDDGKVAAPGLALTAGRHFVSKGLCTWFMTADTKQTPVLIWGQYVVNEKAGRSAYPTDLRTAELQGTAAFFFSFFFFIIILQTLSSFVNNADPRWSSGAAVFTLTHYDHYSTDEVSGHLRKAAGQNNLSDP